MKNKNSIDPKINVGAGASLARIQNVQGVEKGQWSLPAFSCLADAVAAGLGVGDSYQPLIPMPCPPEGETDCSSTLVSIQPGSNLGCAPGSTEPSGYWRLPKVFTIEENGYLYGSYGQSILIIEDAINNANESITLLNKKSKDLQEERDALIAQRKTAEKDRDGVQDEITTLTTELETFKKELDAATAERDKLLADFEAAGCVEPYSEQCQEYVDGINGANAAIAKFIALIEQYEAQIADLQEQLDAYNAVIADLQEQIDDLDSQIEVVNNAVSDNQDAVTALSDQQSELEVKAKELKDCMLLTLETWLGGASISPGSAVGELELYLVSCADAKNYNAGP